jgi:hypothetical protein
LKKKNSWGDGSQSLKALPQEKFLWQCLCKASKVEVLGKENCISMERKEDRTRNFAVLDGEQWKWIEADCLYCAGDNLGKMESQSSETEGKDLNLFRSVSVVINGFYPNTGGLRRRWEGAENLLPQLVTTGTS